ncbi:MAG: HlyD family efflux transporter periplasmic adaptor subunit [Planctomycetes bacterium]|nr:HlyD family efflux transporter periplasmic adaptor subunit [Planctomycetota bacterium]
MSDAVLAIERIAGTDLDRQKFFSELLRLLTAATDATAGAVWMLDDDRVLSVQSQQRLVELGFDRKPDAHRFHVQYLLDVLQRNESCCRASDDHALPIEQTLLIVPFHHKEQCVGMVELFLDCDQDAESLRETDDFLQDATDFATRYLLRHEESHSLSSRLTFWSEFEQVVSDLHLSLRSAEVAAIASNEGRRLIGCDRFSVLTRQGGRTKVRSVSGQGKVNVRSNLIQAMGKLADPVIRSAQSILYDGQTTDFSPQIATPLVNFLKESKSRSILVIPLFLHGHNKDRHRESQEKHRRAYGACVMEWLEQADVSPLKQEHAEALCSHISSALANARKFEGVFLLPLRRFLGGLFGWFRGRRFAAALAVAVLLEVVGFALFMIPARYRVEATGRIMPVVQRDIFAPWDGEIVDIYVESGQQVTQGQQLLKLQNDELEQTLLSLKNRLGERLQLNDVLRVQLGDVASLGNRQEEIRIRGKQAQTEIEIRGISERIATIEKQIDALVVRSPVHGTVATFQLTQLLQNRPATRGEVLLQVMDESQAWHLELDVPERRLGNLQRAAEMYGDVALPVEFVLATAPEKQYAGTLAGSATRIQLSSENEAVLPMLVQFNREDVPLIRIGAKVRAKIDCGEKSLFYVLFGDVVEFVQRCFW